MPYRIELEKAGVALVTVGSNLAVWLQELQRRNYLHAQPREPGVNCELGSIRPNRVVEQDIEHRLVWEDPHTPGKVGTGDVPPGQFIRREGIIRRERHAGFDNLRLWKKGVVFVNIHPIRDPCFRRARKHGVYLRQIQIAAFVGWKNNVGQSVEGHADQQMKPRAFRFGKRLDRDLVRDGVRERRIRQRQKQRGQSGAARNQDPSLHPKLNRI